MNPPRFNSVEFDSEERVQEAVYVGGLPIAELVHLNSIVPAEPRVLTVEVRFKF